MLKKSVPDAWDDDWETLADKEGQAEEVKPEPPEAPLTKAERLAKHAESNKKLWDSAYVTGILLREWRIDVKLWRCIPVNPRSRTTSYQRGRRRPLQRNSNQP